MPLYFLMVLLVCFSPLYVHAQDGEFESSYIEVLNEEDYSDIAEILKLQEAIPIAERNCYRIRKNRKECRCDNANLYNEYNKVIDVLAERHPDWENQTLKYNFFWGRVTYEGKKEFESFRAYTDKYSVTDCTSDDGGDDGDDW